MSTTSTTSSTGSISSTGIGSGLDVNSIISKLMSVEDIPLTNLQTAATSISTSISTYGAVQSAVATFRDAALALTQPGTWSATTGTSSDTTSATVSTGADAVPGNYSIQVQNLAAPQSIVSGFFASSAASVGAGNLHIDLGSWNTPPSAFTAQTGSTGIDIAVSATDTLASLSDKINAAGAGVNASIVTDSTGSRLVLSSRTTGAGNGFRVTATNNDSSNTALSALGYDPASGTTGTTLTQSGVDAIATVNGLTVTSATNTLSNVLQGLTVNLLKATTSPVQVSVAQDTGSIKTDITSFVTAYNALAALLATDTKYDASTSTAGPLQGDSTAIALQRQLRNILGSSSSASSAFSTLSQAGLQIQSDGSIKVNDATLTNALANSTQLKSMFATYNSTDSTAAGFAQQFVSLGDSVLGSDGLLTTRVAGLNASLTSNTNDQDNLNVRLTATEARLRAQYTALDTQMSTISTLSSYITQQIANWNKSTS